MDYLAGEVAELLGISVEGLRNYEKSGIITPKREGSAQYRKYSYLDVTSLIRVKMYRSLGYTLKGIRTLVNEMDIPEVAASLREKREELRADCSLLAGKIEYMNGLVEQMESLEEKLNRTEIWEVPAFYRLEFSRNGEIYTDKEHVKLVREWLSCMPFVHISTRYGVSDVYGGLAVQEKYAGLFRLRESGLVKYEPAGLGLRIRVMEEDNGFSDVSCADELRKFAEYHRFALEQDMIGHTVIGIHKQKRYQRFREISVKIKNI